MDLVEGRTDGLKLSLKLYHAGELQLGYQQLMTEAPALDLGPSTLVCHSSNDVALHYDLKAAQPHFTG